MTIENSLGLGSGTGTQVLRSNSAGNLPTFEDVESCALPIITGATYSTIGDFNIATGTSGVITGLTITDGGSGTIDISSGTMFVRTTASDVGVIFSANFAGDTAVALTDNSINFVYIAYNAGTPQTLVTTTPSATPQDNVVVGIVWREGNDVHISAVNVPTPQLAQKLSRRLVLVEGVTRQTGIVTGETGTRNITITAGTVWLALTDYSLAAFDSSAAGTWIYYYRDGGGGWTAVTSSTQINNTQYDNNSGSLATLSNNQYGVHWVYQAVDDEVYVLYGQDSYTLTDAQEALVPATAPLQITNLHTILIAKIIIQKSAGSFTEILLPWDDVFAGGLASNHNDLSNIQGGATDDFFHMTSVEYGLIDGITTLTDHGFLLGSGTGNITATAAPGNGFIPIGSDGVDPVIALPIGGPGITVTPGAGSLTISSSEAEVAKVGVNNLGFTFASSTFTITAADGSALSSSNKGFVTMQDPSNPGQLLTFDIEAPQGFIDDGGVSEIIDNLFGLITSIAWAQDIPFYIYAVWNSDVAGNSEPVIAFMISRVPHATVAPATANIGAPDDAVADTQGSFFSFDNITETAYSTQPCICIGSLRMRMSSSDDWTVQALSAETDGIGLFQENVNFILPAGVNGAASGKYFTDTGGTAPGFGTNNTTYRVFRNGFFNSSHCYETNDATGVGAVECRGVVPYKMYSPATIRANTGIWVDSGAAVGKFVLIGDQDATDYVTFTEDGVGANLTNGEVNASDSLCWVKQVFMSLA